MNRKRIGACILFGLVLALSSTSSTAQQCDIYISDLQVDGSSTIMIPVHVSQAPNLVDAFGFDIMYTSSALTYTGTWSAGDLTATFDFLDVNSPAPGQIRVGGFTVANKIAQGSSGTLVSLEFSVGDCENTTTSLANLVDDISGWAPCNGNMLCNSGLTRISLRSPQDLSVTSSPPIFVWTTDGGGNNFFAVDLAFSPSGPVYSSFENLHELIQEYRWTMPGWVWSLVPPGEQLYWRVRGVDTDHKPATPITSAEVWSISKE